jgi:hypothetical protein
MSTDSSRSSALAGCSPTSVRRRVDIPTLRAALWAQRALVQVRYGLRRKGVGKVRVASPPALPPSARRGVLSVLRRRSHTCLERALLLQRWEAAQGRSIEVIIGVKGSSAEFNAHAWLEGDPDNDDGSFRELLRLPAA